MVVVGFVVNVNGALRYQSQLIPLSTFFPAKMWKLNLIFNLKELPKLSSSVIVLYFVELYDQAISGESEMWRINIGLVRIYFATGSLAVTPFLAVG